MILTAAQPARDLSGFALLAHVMGMAARDRGETAVDNPFRDEPAAADAWLDGWMRNAVAV